MPALLGVQGATNCQRVLTARRRTLCWISRLNCFENMQRTDQEVRDLKNALRQSLHKIRDLKWSLEAAENASSQPIAIVGMSCRAPGGSTNPESYWSLLESGGDGVGALPGRWSRELLRRLEVVTGGLAQEGGFLDA